MSELATVRTQVNMAKTILLVEDNPDDEALTLRAMNKMNITNQIYVARDGAEALDFLFATGAYSNRQVIGLPTVILLDLKLPKVDGLEVPRRIRSAEQTRFIPVGILTNSNEERDIHTSYDLGANSYFRKPVDFQAFTNLVGQLGKYWLAINVTPPFSLSGY
jgi:two-component system response regulator